MSDDELKSLRDAWAYKRLTELTPYIADRDRRALIEDGHSETYLTAQLAWDAAVAHLSERIRELEEKLMRTSSCEACGYSTMAHEPITLIDTLTARNKCLREALKFYANQKHWKMAYRTDLKDFVPANSEGTSVIETDEGKRARKALAEEAL